LFTQCSFLLLFFYKKNLEYLDLLAKNEKLQIDLINLQIEVSKMQQQNLQISKSLEVLTNTNTLLMYSTITFFVFISLTFIFSKGIDVDLLSKGIEERLLASTSLQTESLVNQSSENVALNMEKLSDGVARLDFVLNSVFLSINSIQDSNRVPQTLVNQDEISTLFGNVSDALLVLGPPPT
jgi:hypothetical protein